MMNRFIPRSLIALAAGAVGVAQAQTIGTDLKVSGLVRPVFVTHAPNDYSRIFIIEKQGRIRIAQITPSGSYNLLATSFLDIDAITTGGTSENSEQGLLGLAFHPDYPTNPRFYVNYTSVAGSGDTVVAEYQVSANPDIANAGSANILMTWDQPQSNHNGGWIGFGPDGYLYVATGDGGNANDQGAGHTEPGGNAQDLTSNRLGKMLRVDVNGDDFPADTNRDYRIPPTNPFVGSGNDGEIWAYGLRNPWRPSFDRGTGDLYIADVGQGSWEEINFQPAGAPGGRNYGWRCYEGNVTFNFDSVCSAAGAFTFPIQVYSHGVGCSITGGYVYRGCGIPGLEGTYFYADYCSARVWSFRYTGSITQFTERTAQLDPPGALTLASITSFGEDAYGEMYICDSTGGEIFKIVSTVATAPDCNANGINDECELLDGSQTDVNNNGVLDACEAVCIGDFDNDGSTNIGDLTALLAAFGSNVGDPTYNPVYDLNNNSSIDLADLTALLADFGCTH